MALPDCKTMPVLRGEAGNVCQQKRETERRKRERSKKVEKGRGSNWKEKWKDGSQTEQTVEEEENGRRRRKRWEKPNWKVSTS